MTNNSMFDPPPGGYLFPITVAIVLSWIKEGKSAEEIGGALGHLISIEEQMQGMSPLPGMDSLEAMQERVGKYSPES